MRVVKEAFLNLRRSGFMSLISIGTIAITVIMLGGYYMLSAGITDIIKRVENKFEVVVFLKDGADAVKTGNLITEAKALPGVSDAVLVSKQDAYEQFSKDPEMKAVMEGFSGNPLPDSVVVKLSSYDRKKVEAVKALFLGKEGVEEVQYGAEEVRELLNVVNAVKLVVMSAGIVFVIASLLVVSNIIKLTIYARRQDIYVFRMVGASDSFIRIPFIIEGFIHGLFGGALGWGVLYGVIRFLLVQIRQETGIDLSGYQMFADAYLYTRFLAGAVFSGITLGFTGSLLSQGRIFK